MIENPVGTATEFVKSGARCGVVNAKSFSFTAAARARLQQIKVRIRKMTLNVTKMEKMTTAGVLSSFGALTGSYGGTRSSLMQMSPSEQQ
jgi:hypothetical protein